MSKHTRTKLLFQKETLIDLSIVIGGVQGSQITETNPNQNGHVHTEVWCETQQTQGCRPSHGGCGTPRPRHLPRPFPKPRFGSLIFCADKPPLSGRTLPPTARD
jgi:hypothetical protein